ncbi:MAG: hypothetical protein KAY03_00115 [Arenimonas sp.]|nr:hypothetical protein [Arenimonas sp.]
MLILAEHPYAVLLGLLATLLLALEIGRLVGRRQMATGGIPAGASAIDGVIFALLGLLLAFTFTGAAQRFDTRRDLIVQEANAIGTAYLRVDVAPEAAQPALRLAFKRYIASRIEVSGGVRDFDQFKAKLAKSNAIQQEVWLLAVEAGHRPDASPATNMLLLPALNEMIDITTTRAMATQMHPPIVVYLMLFGLAFCSAVLAGHGMAGSTRRDWLHAISFVVIMSLALFLILDFEFPRVGLITVNEFESIVFKLTGAP